MPFYSCEYIKVRMSDECITYSVIFPTEKKNKTKQNPVF